MRDIEGKLADGKTLNDDDIAYASDHAIALPAEYDDAVAAHQKELMSGKPAVYPTESVSMGPGLFLSEDELGSLNKAELQSLADAKGIEASGTKAAMVATLSGGAAPTEEAEAEEEG